MTARVGVVGHVEWVDFAVVERLPEGGAIVHASEHFEEAGGGGAVAAVHLRREAGEAVFLTAVGDDALGERAVQQLRERHGIELHAAVRGRSQRRALTHLDAEQERAITVLGGRLVPEGADDLPWDRCSQLDAVYFTGGDAAALRAARAARVLVATPRARDAIEEAGVEVDVLVGSADDPGEDAEGLDARHVVETEGADGGHWTGPDGASGRWEAAPLPGPPVDSYGCGDAFAAALTLALGRGRGIGDAVRDAAALSARVLTLRGPYGR